MTDCNGCAFEIGNFWGGFKKICFDGKTQEVKDKFAEQNKSNVPYETGTLSLRKIEKFAKKYHYKAMVITRCEGRQARATLYRRTPDFRILR
tara:strand:- start:269 stop:544 length:276 start_codon:yes stop_codon:yes gene_type:complete